MAENTLLGSGVPPAHSSSSDRYHPIVKPRAPAWWFHPDCPNGKLFTTEAEVDKAEKSGWLPERGMVQLLPGHEKVWYAYQEKLAAEKAKDEPIKPETLIEPESKPEKTEEEIKAEYEAAKNPPGPRLCTLCGKSFNSLRALNMHGRMAHTERKKK